MYRVAILGCENSHADSFLDYVITQGAIRDIAFVGLYSEEATAVDKLSARFGVPKMERYDELVGKVDGIIITARNGANHYKYAKPYIASGIPMFIDKPITNTEEDLCAFMADLSAHGVRFTGGSSCAHTAGVQRMAALANDAESFPILGGFVRAPISLRNEYGGFPFYAQHLTQAMCKIFGYDPLSVRATQNGSCITLTVRYEGYDVCGQYTEGGYYAGVSCKTGVFGENYGFEGAFEAEFEEFYHILKGGEQPLTAKEFAAPVFMTCAIMRSLSSGEEEKIHTLNI